MTAFAHDPPNIATNAVRALVLYSLAEFQSGNATTIRVHAGGFEFKVADDGRGHAIDRKIAGLPYMTFVYRQLDYPALSPGAPIQPHTVGLSFINTLCSQLVVTVRKQGAVLEQTYRDGRLDGELHFGTESVQTGNVIAGILNPRLLQAGIDIAELQRWLEEMTAVVPGLRLFFNDMLLPSR